MEKLRPRLYNSLKVTKVLSTRAKMETKQSSSKTHTVNQYMMLSIRTGD